MPKAREFADHRPTRCAIHSFRFFKQTQAVLSGGISPLFSLYVRASDPTVISENPSITFLQCCTLESENSREELGLRLAENNIGSMDRICKSLLRVETVLPR